jgi:hypothetical protein
MCKDYPQLIQSSKTMKDEINIFNSFYRIRNTSNNYQQIVQIIKFKIYKLK